MQIHRQDSLQERLSTALEVPVKQLMGLEYRFRDYLADFRVQHKREMTEQEWYQFIKEGMENGSITLLESSNEPIL